jgi:hypothetical protein
MKLGIQLTSSEGYPTIKVDKSRVQGDHLLLLSRGTKLQMLTTGPTVSPTSLACYIAGSKKNRLILILVLSTGYETVL